MSRDLFIINVEIALFKGSSWLVIKRSDDEEHAPGTLAMPGGTVEHSDGSMNILEKAAKRELLEEVGLQLKGDVTHIENKAFSMNQKSFVVAHVFAAEYESGDVMINPAEVSEVTWLTNDEIQASNAPEWIKVSFQKAEAHRLSINAS